MFEYKMVQIPPNISVDRKTNPETAAANYLEKIVNSYASQGWEFYRTDTIGVQAAAGCLNAGQQNGPEAYCVISFRKQK